MSVSPRPKSRQRPNCGCNSLAKSDEEKELKQAASSELCSSPGPRSSHSLQTSDSFTYEHFPIVCPTCRGSGKIPEVDESKVRSLPPSLIMEEKYLQSYEGWYAGMKECVEEASGLVAFLPFGDERLKPSRLIHKATAVLIVSLIIGGLAFAFLYPRAVTLSLTDVYPTNFTFIPDKNPSIILKHKLTVVNKNFFPVALKRIDSQVFFLEGEDKESPHEVGSKTVNLDLLVNLRDTSKLKMTINTTYQHSDSHWVWISASIHYWLHSETISTANHFWLDCGKT